jgi:hypothetical protein
MHVKGPGEPIDQLYKQVTSNGKKITADGLYALRREVIKDKELSPHETEVLQKAVDLYNKTANVDRKVSLVNLTKRDMSNPDEQFAVETLGMSVTKEADEHTVRFHQGPEGTSEMEAELDGTGKPGQSLSFDRFVSNNKLETIFRDPASPRHLPYLIDTDQNSAGDTVGGIVGQLRLGQEENFASIKDLQKYLNANRPAGAKKLREDGKMGPQTVQAIRSRIEANIAAADTSLALNESVYASQVMFRGPSTNRKSEEIGYVRVPNLRDHALAQAIKERAQFIVDHPVQIPITPKGKLSID